MTENPSTQKIGKNPKKKHTKLLVLIVLVLSAGGYFGLRSYQKYQKTWNGTIETIFPYDIDHDGQDDSLLIINSYSLKDKKFPMKVIDMKSRKLLWKNFAERSVTYSYEMTSAIAQVGKNLILDVLDHDYDADQKAKLFSYNAKTGTQEWNIELPANHFRVYSPTVAFKDSLYTVVSIRDDHQLFSIDSDLGKKNWSVGIPRFWGSPILFRGQLYFAGDEILSVNLVDGTNHVEGGRGTLFVENGELFVFVHGTHGLNRWDVKSKSYVQVIPPGIISPEELKLNKTHDKECYQYIALNDGRAVFAFHTDEEGRRQTVIQAIPYQSQQKGFRYFLGDGFDVSDDYYRHVEWFAPNLSAFHLIESRYIPLYLAKTVDNEEDKDRLVEEQQLIVFDLKDGKSSWKSKVNKELMLLHMESDFVRMGKDFVVFYPLGPDPHEDTCLLVLDGATGSFTGVKEIRYNDENALHYYSTNRKPEHFQSGLYYGFYRDAAWAFDINKLELSFATSDKIKVVDARGKVEARLGKLP